ncbi:MAG TPA: nitrate reductase, partial [Chthoniobacterales bacterium]
CPYCGVGCGMILHVEDNRIVKVEGDKNHPANYGKLCSKGANCAPNVSAKDRLAHAQVRPRRDAPHARVPVAQAVQEAGQKLRSLVDAHGPDSVAIYSSGQLSMEAQYLTNKLMKGFIGTNNIEANSRLCMASAAQGYKLSLGSDAPPGSYQDFEKSDCFFVIGSNMAECHPILFTRLLAARKKSGAKLIVVDPRRTPTAEKADLYLPIEPGTDLALLNGLLHLFVENGRVDPGFIARYTEGWEGMPEFLDAYTPTRVSELTGLHESDIRTTAQWMGEARELMSLWTMGLNQSTQGTWSNNAVCNLHLATGKICRPGSGPFSLSGQPNAMGGREMGYLSAGLPGQRTVLSAADRAYTETFWGLPSGRINPEAGPDAVEMFKRLKSGEIKAVWILCTNPVASMPRRAGVIEALEAAELVIVQDAYHPTETTPYADILLPGALWAEAEGVMVNSERGVTLMQKAVEPPGEACADWALVARVASAMGYGPAFKFNSAADVFDEIRQTDNPQSGYDLRGMTHERLRRDGSLQWPCGPGGASRNPIRYLVPSDAPEQPPTIRFATESGRARFFARPHLAPDELPDNEFPFILTTGRCPHQWHTMTKTGKVLALNRLNPGPFLEVHPEDADELGIAEGDAVEVRSRRGRAIYPARVTPRIRAGCCFAPFHWNDVFGEILAINAATNEAVDPISKQPEFKFCAVQLSKSKVASTAATSLAGAVPSATATPQGFTLEAALAQWQDHPLTAQQKEYLHGLVVSLLTSSRRLPASTANLPEEAGFSPRQRAWVSGLLAGAFSEANPRSPGR